MPNHQPVYWCRLTTARRERSTVPDLAQNSDTVPGRPKATTSWDTRTTRACSTVHDLAQNSCTATSGHMPDSVADGPERTQHGTRPGAELSAALLMVHGSQQGPKGTQHGTRPGAEPLPNHHLSIGVGPMPDLNGLMPMSGHMPVCGLSEARRGATTTPSPEVCTLVPVGMTNRDLRAFRRIGLVTVALQSHMW